MTGRRGSVTPGELVERLDSAVEGTTVPGVAGSGHRKKPAHPNTLKALELHRRRTQFGGGGLKTCRHCRAVAVRGLDVCQHHGGAAVLRERRLASGKPVGNRASKAAGAVRRIIRQGKLPPELAANPVFRAVVTEYLGFVEEAKAVAGTGRRRRGQNAAELQYRSAVRLLVWELARGWGLIARDDNYGPWTDAVAKARELGLTGG